MTEYVFPAVFHSNDDGSYTVTFPDLPGCISEGKSLGNAISMAEAALKQWIEYLSEKNEQIPAPRSIDRISVESRVFPSYIRVETRDKRAVRRTVSLPRWMDEGAVREGLSLSRVLQDALEGKLQKTR